MGQGGIYFRKVAARFWTTRFILCSADRNGCSTHSPDKSLHTEIQIKLSEFDEEDVSFTYPDSMISFAFGNEKPV